jgi:hypothetical protein
VTLGLTYIFRAEIRSLIGSLRRFTWGDKIAEFDKRLEAAEDEAKDLPQIAGPPLALPAPSAEPGDLHFEAVLELSPDLAVLEAWLPVERELEALAARKGYETSRIQSATYAIRRLRSDGVLDRRIEGLINDLRKLRNLAAHRRDGPPLTIEDARRYEELASLVVDALRTA